MGYKIKKKRAVSLLEVVITLALISIIMVEVTTFIVYAGRQSIKITQQEECFSIVSAIKTYITNKFNNDETIFDDKNDSGDYDDEVTEFIDDVYKLVIIDDYEKYIYHDKGITIKKHGDNIFVCEIKYCLDLELEKYDTISFVLYRHIAN